MHIPLPTIPHEDSSLPNQPFFSWLRTQTGLLVGQIVALLTFVYTVAAVIYYIKGSTFPTWLVPDRKFVIYTHLLILVIFIGALIRMLRNSDPPGRYRARLVYKRLRDKNIPFDQDPPAALEEESRKQVESFQSWFLAFWVAMLALYLAFAFQLIYEPEARNTAAAEIALARTQIISNLSWPFVIFLMNNVSLFFIFRCFVVMYVPSRDPARLVEPKRRRGRIVIPFLVMLALLTAAFPAIALWRVGPLTTVNWKEYPAVFDALSGTLNAVVLALLIARLDSKLIALPSWLICILYFYAGVQPLFVVFELQPEEYKSITTAVLLVVLIFKIYFFLIIVYQLREGRLFNYFYCSRLLNDHVKEVSHSAGGPKPFEPIKKVKQILSSVLAWSLGLIETGAADVTSKLRRISGAAAKARGVFHHPPEHPLMNAGQLKESNVKSVSAEENENERDNPERAKELASSTARSNDDEPKKGLDQFKERNSLPVNLNGNGQKEGTPFILLVSKVFGVIGILVFVGPLLYFAARFGTKIDLWVTSPDTSKWIIYLHLLPLLPIALLTSWWMLDKNPNGEKDLDSEKDPGGEKDADGEIESHRQPRDSLSWPSQMEPSKHQLDTIKHQLGRFKLYFFCFWVVMTLLYVAMAMKSASEVPRSQLCAPTPAAESSPSPVSPLSQIRLTVLAFQVDVVPAAGTVNQSGSAGQHGDQSEKAKLSESTAKGSLDITDVLFDLRYSLVFFALNCVTVFCVFSCFRILYVPGNDKKYGQKHTRLFGYSILIGALLIFAFPLLLLLKQGSTQGSTFNPADIEKISRMCAGVGGTLTAVAFALLLARLDSRLIGVPPWLISVLYGYAALQPLFVVFDGKCKALLAIETSALAAAFIFKICLLLTVVYVLRSGRLRNYLLDFPRLNSRVNSIFDNQFEIRTYRVDENKFTFSIFKEKREVYKTEETWDSRSKCDDIVGDVRKRMEIRDHYGDPIERYGTYWLKVDLGNNIDLGHKVTCESISLRSNDEAIELIDESIEKVPNCKYDRG
jgi:hypothetical protein